MNIIDGQIIPNDDIFTYIVAYEMIKHDESNHAQLKNINKRKLA